ncbi:MAG: hypothetical protein J6P13_07665 [Kiritimatiellae bacterium]|nr:hypothetical protein [Kiritimatiellia bacterium]
MTVDELNTKYGAPGRIVFRTGHCGYPEVALANKYGTAEVALLGGNTLSYKPTGQPPVIFRTMKRDYNRSDGVHCGIPVCWPWFGKSGDPGTKPHGFARISLFTVRGTQYSDEMTEVTLGLKSSDDTKAFWPYDFDLELKVSVSMKLNLSLRTKNTGSESFLLTEGFHPYFMTGDLKSAYVRGVDGLDYVDARDMSKGVFEGDFPVAEPCDHVVTLKDEPKHEFALVDPALKRAIGIVSTGNRRLVMWNPGGETRLSDQAEGEWAKFVCVEPATLWREAGFTIAPGEEHVLAVAIQGNLEMA